MLLLLALALLLLLILMLLCCRTTRSAHEHARSTQSKGSPLLRPLGDSRPVWGELRATLESALRLQLPPPLPLPLRAFEIQLATVDSSQ